MSDPDLALEIRALEGPLLRLEPYEEALEPEVRAALDCDPEAWNLFALCGRGEHFVTWWSRLNQAMRGGHWVAYAIRDRASGRVVGTSSFLNLKPDRQSVEIGATFLHPDVRGGHVNPAAKLMMLQYAFGRGARRVELLTDVRNVRSQAAIAKLGAVREGVLRRDRRIWTGHVRDSVLFSVTDLDWPAVEAGLLARLGLAGVRTPPNETAAAPA